MSESKMKVECTHCGIFMRRDIIAEHGRTKDTPGNWPMESDAAGVNPVQIPEAMAHDRKTVPKTQYEKK